MTETQAVANRILRDRRLSANKEGAVAYIRDRLAQPGGLTYQEFQTAKREIGEMLKAGEPSISNTELEALYGALRKDTRNAADMAGGTAGLAAFDAATDMSRAIINDRQALRKIIGAKGDKAPEDVFKAFVNMAKEQGNKDLLAKAKAVISPSSWNDLSSGVIQNLGKGQTKDFDPSAFVRNFYKMGDENKDIMFGAPGTQLRDALEDISTISRRYEEYGQKHNLANAVMALSAIAGIGTMMYEGPLAGASHDVMAGLGTVPLAWFMSRPRAAAIIARHLRAPSADTLSDARNVFSAELRQVFGPRAKPVAAEDQGEERPMRAHGGKISKREYPAKRLTRMEKAVKRAQDAIALETKPLMNMPDHTIAQALTAAKDK